MRTAASREFLALGISDWNRLRSLGEAVPDFFKQPQPLCGTERQDVLSDSAHVRILRFSLCSRKPDLTADNAAYQPRRALRAGGCMRLFGGALTAAVSRAIRSARNTFSSD